MKNLILMTITVLSSTILSAQTFLIGGLNVANITKTNSGQTEDNNALISFNAGLIQRFGISSFVDIETGLMLNGKGSKAETYFNSGNDYVKSTFNPIYLEIPLNAVVKIAQKKGNGIYFNAGPYIAMGIAGKSKTNSKIGILTSSSEKSVAFSNDDPFTSYQDDASYNKLKRFDYGFNLGGGIEMNKTIIRLNYGLGLSKINSTESNNNANDKNKYRTLSLSIGFALGN